MRKAVGVAVTVAVVVACSAAAAQGAVLRVGTWHHIRGQYRSIQAAVNAAKPGDWVLIAPGDYKTRSYRAPKDASDVPAGVLVTTARLRIRGMNRNTTILDGTRRGTRCNSVKANQNFGPTDSGGTLGLNGIEVYKATDVWVENLTACNFLGGSGKTGNEIWWNGGADSAKIGGRLMYGSFLTTTSTFFDPNDPNTAATYGIYSNNWTGGTWRETYASNFNDSGYYIGACQQVCDQNINAAWSEYSALGYSGSNSGGRLDVHNSEFDNNEDGFDTNSQNGDNPPPQDGACPGNGISPITHTHSCWVFRDNYVHDNNNPDVPSAGFAAAGPVGTGISLSGARNDTVIHNRFVRNNAWGTIVVPFPDSGPPCTGGTQTGAVCLFDEWGDAILDNTYENNGGYGNPTNGDIALTNAEPGPTDCFAGNQDPAGLTTTPSNAEQTYPTCDGSTVPPSDTNPQSAQFTEEVACDSQLAIGGQAPPCAPTDHYPRRTSVVMHPLPRTLKSMPNPCSGVPRNPWCPKRRSGGLY